MINKWKCDKSLFLIKGNWAYRKILFANLEIDKPEFHMSECKTCKTNSNFKRRCQYVSTTFRLWKQFLRGRGRRDHREGLHGTKWQKLL